MYRYLLIAVFMFMFSAAADAQRQTNKTQPASKPTASAPQSLDAFRADAFKAIDLVMTKRFNEAAPITEKLLRQAQTVFAKEADVVTYLLILGNAYENGSRYDDAAACLREAIAVFERVSGNETAVCLQKTIATLEKLSGEKSTNVAYALNWLGLIYYNQGHYAEAEPLYMRALEIREAKLGKDHRDTIISLDNLAVLYKDQGRYAEAESFNERALKIWETKFGKDHLDTANSQNNLAMLYRDQGRYAEVEPLLKQTLEIREAKLGKDHPDTAVSLNNMAAFYKSQGRYVEAEPLYKRALEINETKLGKDHPHTAVLLDNLAELYGIQGRYAEAESLHKRALKIWETKLGKDHPGTAISLNNLAALYKDQGRYAEAEPLYKRVLEISETKLGKDHPHTAVLLDNLAALYNNQGRYAEAESLYKRALKIWETKLGKDHPHTATSLNNQAFLYNEQSRYAEAEPLYDRAIAIYNANPTAADFGQGLYSSRSRLYKETNRPDKAVVDLKRAMDLSLEVRKHASGSDEQRAETFARYYSLFEMMVSWQYELGDMNEAYEAMERSRAQGLQDLVNSHGIDLLAGVATETAKKLRAAEAAALMDVASCEKQLEVLPRRADMTAERKKAEEAKLTEALKVARKKLVDAMAAIRSASPAYRLMIAEDRKPVALDAVRRDLIADKALALEYLIGEGKSHLLIYGVGVKPKLLPLELNKKQAKLFGVEAGPLTAKKIETIMQNGMKNGVLQSIADVRRIPANGLPDAATAEKLHVLWSVLIPDQATRDRIVGESLERLLVLPDGALAKLPFEMLIVVPDPVSPQYLLDRGPAVTYAPSASMYYNLKRLNTPTRAKAALTVGNPLYDAKTPSGDSRGRRAGHFRAWKPLAHTADETSWIADSCKENGFAVTRLDGKESTEANVRKNVAGRLLVHLACHGMAEEEYGNMFGGLALTVGNPNDPRDDGFLELAEMFALNLKGCELAILSACETNLGPNQHGEGTWSMSRGMLASGSRRVVTTNWQVADDASARLVYLFVNAVNRSGDFSYVAQSLHQAKRDMRSGQKNPAWRHPYYWAPFVLVGGK